MDLSWSAGKYEHSTVSCLHPTLHLHPTRHQTTIQHPLRCNEYNVHDLQTPLHSDARTVSYPILECRDFNVHIPAVSETPWRSEVSPISENYMISMLSPSNSSNDSGVEIPLTDDFFNACHNELIQEAVPMQSHSFLADRTSGMINTLPYTGNTDDSQHVFAVPTSPAPKNSAHRVRAHTSSEPKCSYGWTKYRDKNQVARRQKKLDISHENSMQNPRTVYRSWSDMKSLLSYQDYTEITHLQNSYLQLIDELPPPFKGPVTPDNFQLYASTFLQRRAKFFVTCPWYESLGGNDKQHLLRVAVAISCYILGAQLIDWESYTWPRRGELPIEIVTNEPTMPLYTLRQFLSNDQFVNLMIYCKSFSKAFSDIRVSLMLQTLSLFYPEPGVEDIMSLEAGRSHYTGLLSRYLTAVHGHETGQFHLQTLLDSQHEARQLANMLNSIEIVHHARVREFFDAKKMMVDGIRLVCDEAKERLLRVQNRKRRERQHQNDSLVRYKRPKTELAACNSSQDNLDRVDLIQSTFTRLADCDDPEVLAEARRLIPVHLLQKLLKNLQEPSNDSHHFNVS